MKIKDNKGIEREVLMYVRGKKTGKETVLCQNGEEYEIGKDAEFIDNEISLTDEEIAYICSRLNDRPEIVQKLKTQVKNRWFKLAVK